MLVTISSPRNEQLCEYNTWMISGRHSPQTPFPIGFEMAATHSLLSFIGRAWEKGNKAS